jgi:hypothetical protein
MAPIDTHRRGRAGRIQAIVRYALVCVAAGAGVAGLAIAVLGGADRDAAATLPPVREIQLVKAVEAGRCRLHRVRDDGLTRATVRGDAVAARPGFYDRAPPAARLTAALRRGVIVIAYRPQVGARGVERLRALQQVVPRGTIGTRGPSAMRNEVQAAAFGRVLGCRRFTDAAVDAVRLFRGRYLGIGPDR